jgi:hypothetical protein
MHGIGQEATNLDGDQGHEFDAFIEDAQVKYVRGNCFRDVATDSERRTAIDPKSAQGGRDLLRRN